jgi:predicted RNA-binding protein YlxR (DUF448 family)
MAKVQTTPVPSKKKKQPVRRKHVPMRTCVVCRVERAKRDLVRIVRTPTGQVEIDLTGKKAGRGAYLCRQRSCWEDKRMPQALERALQTTLLPEAIEAFALFRQTLPAELPRGEAGSAG